MPCCIVQAYRRFRPFIYPDRKATEYSKTSVHFYLAHGITSRKQLPQQNYPRKQGSHVPLGETAELLGTLSDRPLRLKVNIFCLLSCLCTSHSSSPATSCSLWNVSVHYNAYTHRTWDPILRLLNLTLSKYNSRRSNSILPSRLQPLPHKIIMQV
jgi:hypothetical protein